MAMSERIHLEGGTEADWLEGHHPAPVDDPEFYCHGQECIDDGCSPLFCKDVDPHADPQPRS